MDILAFFVGSILIGVAVIGGGFEAKDVRIPKVGVFPRILSTFAGFGFISLAVGLYAQQHPGNAQAMGDALSSAAPAPAATQFTSDTIAAAPAADIAVASVDTTSAAAEPNADDGTYHGNVTIGWSVEGVEYSAILTSVGATGTATVSYTNGSGQHVDVDEDIALQQRGESWYYVSGSARLAGTTTPFPDYRPDLFRVSRNESGQWIFDQVCDVDACVAVSSVSST
ncbi:MAG TPA: hypothetical protein VFE05_19580 [Longimicrobiaceae bacterium]|jgi:hypothetical protein|nr:hypothetical protein [Longimicrobiaceae bacterium]